MKLPPFEYAAPATVAEATGVLATDEDAKVIAGGQSLMPLLALRLARPSTLVDLQELPLHGLSAGPGPLRIGALVRQRRLERDPAVARHAPLLADAVRQVGYPATRNRGTLAGSLAHADPVAELPAVAAALGATAVVAGPAGTREVPCCELPAGFFATTLAPDEIITEVRVPQPDPVPGGGRGAAWCEWAPRAHDFAVAGAGVDLDVDADGVCVAVRAAACGVGGGPLPLSEVLGGAGLLGARPGEGRLAGAVAAAVEDAARGAGAGADVAELAGLLAARAAHRALAGAAAPAGAAA
jgi:CO/xanthine dehydrogenase FAD-binding subunit